MVLLNKSRFLLFILLGCFSLSGITQDDTTKVNPVTEILDDLTDGLTEGKIDSSYHKQLVERLENIGISTDALKESAKEVFKPLNSAKDFWDLYNWLWGSISALLIAGVGTSFGAQFIKLKAKLDKNKSIVTVALLAITFAIGALFLKGDLSLVSVLVGSGSVGTIATIIYKYVLKRFFGNGDAATS